VCPESASQWYTHSSPTDTTPAYACAATSDSHASPTLADAGGADTHSHRARRRANRDALACDGRQRYTCQYHHRGTVGGTYIVGGAR